MKDKWQNELNALQLSREAKQKIYHNLNRKKTPLSFKIVMPSFIALVCFFVYLALPHNGQQPVVQGDGITYEFDHQKIFAELIIWQFISLFALIAWLTQLTLLSLKTAKFAVTSLGTRYITWLQKARTSIWRILLLILGITVCIVLIQLVPLFWIGSVAYFQWTTMLFVTFNSICILLWQIRDDHLPHCPCCHEQFEKSQLRKVIWMSFNIKCPYCDAKIYVSKASRRKWSYTSLYLIILFVPQMVGIPFLAVICSMAIYTLFLLSYYYYYSVKFTTEDEAMW